MIKSPLRYPGGKSKALRQISQMFPQKVYDEYREPMVGGGSVYLLARQMGLAQSYWINDLFDDLYYFLKTLGSKEETDKMIKLLLHLHQKSRDPKAAKWLYEKAKESEPDARYIKAAAFFYLNRVTFSGTTMAGGYSASAAQSRFTRSSIHRVRMAQPLFEDCKITSRDFEDVIIAPADGSVFLFLDAPYYNAKKLYGNNGELHTFDHERLAYVLRRRGHDFLMTYDDCPEIRKLYKWANIKPFELQYGMDNVGGAKPSKGNDIFIYNYSLE